MGRKSKLSEEQRKYIADNYLHMSYFEIANKLDIPASTVSYHVSLQPVRKADVNHEKSYDHVLELIVSHALVNNALPSIREIVDACGFGSTSTARNAMLNLQREGKLILSDGGMSRSYKVVGLKYVYCPQEDKDLRLLKQKAEQLDYLTNALYGRGLEVREVYSVNGRDEEATSIPLDKFFQDALTDVVLREIEGE